ncbi:unnamed protein product [Blepharisma stoltei]|uniref:non-specific serine/threonine protein kinase n=1 Tax=Blepharisma stoltei TaxID=1481888 RepID=A0AAU9K306_9CILI|nr:unnamed protein product [Blepharisma stoltei]
MGCGRLFSPPKNSKCLLTTKQESLNVTFTPRTFVQKHTKGLSDDYIFQKNLGSGAYSEVKLYYHSTTLQYRAVKQIQKSGLNSCFTDPVYRLKEVKILCSLDHPNILRCFEVFEDDLKYYVVTEYCEGGELFETILNLKGFSEHEAANIMSQLLSAISYCHEHSVIHRDLKPENVLLEEKNGSLSLKVADFGSSCLLDPQRKMTGCFGSAFYIAPEVLDGEYDEKCDLWSCGVIMFVLLTGRPPYRGKNVAEILAQIKAAPLQISQESIPRLSSEAADLLQKLLEISPKNRIEAREALRHPWIQNYRNYNEDTLGNSLDELRSFHSASKLKDAVHTYVASQAVSYNEIKLLKAEFLALDKNGDGKLSKAELFAQYKKRNNEEDAAKIVKNVMDHVDTDHSGWIDYTEFLKACMDYSNLISHEKLESAFKMFDKDGSGDITVLELKEALGQEFLTDDSFWRSILEEADANQDGVIDLKEFMDLMTERSLNSPIKLVNM